MKRQRNKLPLKNTVDYAMRHEKCGFAYACVFHKCLTFIILGQFITLAFFRPVASGARAGQAANEES